LFTSVLISIVIIQTTEKIEKEKRNLYFHIRLINVGSLDKVSMNEDDERELSTISMFSMTDYIEERRCALEKKRISFS
jgi:hypothetical protein